MRLAMRKICVSTAMVASPNKVFNITLAVFRPTPGKLSKPALIIDNVNYFKEHYKEEKEEEWEKTFFICKS